MKQAFYLYILSLKSFWHRLRYDFAQELVIGLSSIVLMGLFYYIVKDFLNSEIKQLSYKMYQSFSLVVGLLLLILGAGLPGFRLATEWKDEHSFVRIAQFLGETKSNCYWYWCFRMPTVLLIFYLPCLWLVCTSLVPWLATSPGKLMLLFVSMFVFSASVFCLRVFVGSSELLKKDKKNTIILPFFQSPVSAMSCWKLQQLLTRNRLSMMCLSIALVFCLLNAYLSLHQIPFVASVGASASAGLFTAAALAFQFAEDIRHSWVEKNFAVSHRQYDRSIKWTTLLIASAVALANTVLWRLATTGSWDLFGVDLAAKLFFITFIPPWVLPYVLFQIDGKRPLITWLSVILSSLLLVTAVYAHILALGLLPIVAYYGNQSQEGRFYRV
jgi:hypothetical protein